MKAKVKVTQLRPTPCDPMDHTVYGVLQVRILELVAFPFAMGLSQPRSSSLQTDSLPTEPSGKPHGLSKTGIIDSILKTRKIKDSKGYVTIDSLDVLLFLG